MNYALIFAGGCGSRMHTNGIPKQFLRLYDKPIIAYTLEHFQNHPLIDGIVVVSVASHMEQMRGIIRRRGFTKVIDVVEGGSTGQKSIWNGLVRLEKEGGTDDVVLIHDGVRPNIDEDLINRNINCVLQNGNAISCAFATETFCLTADAGHLGRILRRAECMTAKAPQSFYLKDIIAAHRQAQAEQYEESVDSAALMMHCGHQLNYVLTDSSNIKITEPQDYYLFKGLLEARESRQIQGL